MGFSMVGASAVLFTAIAATGYSITTTSFDTQEDLRAAQEAARDLDVAMLRDGISITSVSESGGTVTIIVRNVGSATLVATKVDVLLDGQPATVSGRTVEGVASAVWPPLADLTLTLTAAAPTDVAVATGSGAQAFWRA